MKPLSRKQLLAKLVLKELLPARTASTIEQQLSVGESIVSHLIHEHGFSPNTLAHFISHETQLPFCHLSKLNRQQLPLNIIDQTLQTRFTLIPLKLDQQNLDVALADPTFENIIPTLAKITHKFIKVFIAPEDELQKILQQMPENHSELSENETEIIPFINEIIGTAVAKNASDIHFEPYEKNYRIRFRIDGVLHTIFEPETNLAARLTTRLKIMANLDIAEKRLPQDGRFKQNITGEKSMSCRVSTCPTLFGEKIVVRLLDLHNAQFNISNLGFTPEQETVFLTALAQNQGMVLVTGPTGSGKTMTLYSALSRVNSPDKNISSAEDPIEIYLPGINQVNINLKAGLDFATALRAFLRQDPDIIMVGEIRDNETSEIAVKAAQTGHLVLSTVHTNNAVETLTRLGNLGIAAFNIATTLNLIIAQRLVRCLCQHCKIKTIPDKTKLPVSDYHELESFDVYEPQGCHLCMAGYQGRIGIFELLPITDEIQHLILEQESTPMIAAAAHQAGMLSLRSAGLLKVKQGITSWSELQRVL